MKQKFLIYILIVAMLVASSPVMAKIDDSTGRGNPENSQGMGAPSDPAAPNDNNPGNAQAGNKSKTQVPAPPKFNKTVQPIPGNDMNKTVNIPGQQAVNAINRSSSEGNASNASIQARMRNTERIQAHIAIMNNASVRERARLESEMSNESDSRKKVLSNQNRVRVAVHSLQQLWNLSGPEFGESISRIVREFNNSVKATIQAEHQINNRGRLVRALFGGDEDSASEIEDALDGTEAGLVELDGLGEVLPDELRQAFQIQVNELKLERQRLRELAQKEKSEKGLLGWLFK